MLINGKKKDTELYIKILFVKVNSKLIMCMWINIYFGEGKESGVCLVTKSWITLFVTPWTVGHQAPPSIGFLRQGYWSGLPFPSPGDLPYPGIELSSPALEVILYCWATREAQRNHKKLLILDVLRGACGKRFAVSWKTIF